MGRHEKNENVRYEFLGENMNGNNDVIVRFFKIFSEPRNAHVSIFIYVQLTSPSRVVWQTQ